MTNETTQPAAVESTEPATLNDLRNSGDAYFGVPEKKTSKKAPKKSSTQSKGKKAVETKTAKKTAPAKKSDPKTAKKAPKTAKKTAPAKKTPTPKKTETKKEENGVVWSDKRIALVKALISLGAIDGLSAAPADKVATKAKLSVPDVKHYGWKDGSLVLAGYVGQAKLEGATGIHYYVTKSGQKALPQ